MVLLETPMTKASTTLVLIAVLAGAIVGALTARVGAQTTFDHLKVFTQVLRYVKAYYVEDPNPKLLVNDAIRWMLQDLDPYSEYVEAESLASFVSWIQPQAAKQTAPAPQSIQLVVLRRLGATAAGKSVPNGILLEDGTTGYVSITRFSSTTADELEAALKDLESKGMKRLILDLRNNPGGLLNQSIEVADKFIDGRQVLVYTKGRIDGSSQHYYATDSTPHPLYPLIVLVNKSTASGSEVVAGAIQDHDRGLVAGSTTFGHGLVQRHYILGDGSSLLLTVANFRTPSGRLIQRPYPSVAQSKEAPAKADSTIFYTLHARRPVQGGGGITPDVSIESPPETRSKDLAKDPMIVEALRHFPEAEKMAKTYAALPKDKR